MPRHLDYKTDLLEDLRTDSAYAAHYLSAAEEDSQEAFLVALRDVVEARKGMTIVAAEAEVNRENLYRALSKDGNPTLSTYRSVLRALGIKTQYVEKSQLGGPVNMPPLTSLSTSEQTPSIEAAGTESLDQIKTPGTPNVFAPIRGDDSDRQLIFVLGLPASQPDAVTA